LGHLAGVPVASFSGRVHFYEGHGMDVPALLPRLLCELGAATIVVTAAVGGVEPGLAGGTVAVITDHLNMMGTAPLRGWRSADGMPAFIAMGGAYDPGLAELALERAHALGIAAAPGVYAAMSGPAYETPTEIELIGRAGATVVGMSMVPEVLPARALGMRVLGLAMVTNALGEPVSHEEVVRVSNETAVAVGRLLVDLLPRIDEGAGDGM
jgi:purine-nucleoside phosphorylase